jgi:hypothetical protein
MWMCKPDRDYNLVCTKGRVVIIKDAMHDHNGEYVVIPENLEGAEVLTSDNRDE